MLWATCRTGDETFAGAFYLAQYGIRVAGASNTLVAWRPKHLHGSGLQKVRPDDCVSFRQTGLAIVTSSHITKVWCDYQAGLVGKDAATAQLAEGSDVKYD